MKSMQSERSIRTRVIGKDNWKNARYYDSQIETKRNPLQASLLVLLGIGLDVRDTDGGEDKEVKTITALL